MWEAGCGHPPALVASAQLSCRAGQDGSGRWGMPHPRQGEMPDTGMFVEAGHQPVPGTSRCGAQGRGPSAWGGGGADLREAVSLGWGLASRYRIWHQSHLRTVGSTLPRLHSHLPTLTHPPQASCGDQQILALVLSNTRAPPRPEKLVLGELLSHHQRNCGQEGDRLDTVSWRMREPLHPNPSAESPVPSRGVVWESPHLPSHPPDPP